MGGDNETGGGGDAEGAGEGARGGDAVGLGAIGAKGVLYPPYQSGAVRNLLVVCGIGASSPFLGPRYD